MAVLLGLVVGACTGGGKPLPTPSSTHRVAPTPRAGGELVLGAEQWPECVNPITTCAASDWTHYTVLQHVLPRAMEIDPKGNYVSSALLEEAPTLENGGLRQSPFTVTYRIADEAVWDDGSPITSRDFAFTWRAYLSTRGAYEAEDYALIESIDATDPHVAVIRFQRPFAQWPELFGGQRGYVLKRAAFPEADRDSPDLRKEMLRSIPFSGGPWRLADWSNDRAILIPNERYFGTVPMLDRVTFLPILTQAMEIEGLLDGRFAAIYPQVGLPIDDATGGLLNAPDIGLITGPGLYFEALWFNHGKHPLDEPTVREALLYAVDREAILDEIIRPLDLKAEVLGCGFIAFPHLGPWCDTKPFERFDYDPARARAILEGAAYNCSATFCTKNGRPLTIRYSVNEGNVRRLATQSLVLEQARAAGFDLRVRNFGSTLCVCGPEMFAISEFAAGGELDPSVTDLFSCDGIPPRGDPNPATNWAFWCDPEADRLMKESDREIDPARRLGMLRRIHQLQAADFLGLPLYVLPAVTAWRTDLVAGPIGLYNGHPYGPFFNMDEWHVP